MIPFLWRLSVGIGINVLLGMMRGNFLQVAISVAILMLGPAVFVFPVAFLVAGHDAAVLLSAAVAGATIIFWARQ